MEPEKILEIIAKYRQYLEEIKCEPVEFPLDGQAHGRMMLLSDHAALNHCYSMIPRMEQFMAEGRIDKAVRWLCFIQGVLFRCGEFTIDQMREHNRTFAQS